MAYIPVNPERRDPGYFKKKAEIGLPSVDNMSAAEFVNAVSEDVKTLGNRKKLSSKITKKGEFYGGLLKTAPKNSHAEFTIGLFNSSNSAKELASVHVDFVFSCTSSDEFGHVNYTVSCPDEDPYLKNLYIVFSQVDDQVFVTLHSPSLPGRSSQVYFNIIGVNLLDWTVGVERLDSSKDISEKVKNHELARVRLTGPSSTIGSGFADSLAVYGDGGRKVSLDDLSSLDNLDYPSINGVPFIGKKDLLIGNQETGRHIIVPAYHKDSTREGSGVHDWEVLDDLKKINVSKSETGANPGKSSRMPNNTEFGYGLVRPSKYKILPSSSVSKESITTWLDSLGEDTDVITVGAFKEYMSYLIKVFSGSSSTVNSYHLYLKNSEDLFKYVPSEKYKFNLQVYSFLKKVGSNSSLELSPISITSSAGWILPEAPKEMDGTWSIDFDVDSNPEDIERSATITITQKDTDREIEISVIQSKFEVKYGILLNGGPVYEDQGFSLDWDTEGGEKTLTIVPIKTCPKDIEHPEGYEEINDYQDPIFTNTNSWISGELEENTLTLSVESNYMSSTRYGTIHIGVLEISGGKFKYIPIKCSQKAAKSYLYIDGVKDESAVIQNTVGKEETTKRFLVSSNYTWMVSENTVPSWISLSGYTEERPSGSSYLTMIISENNTQSSREAEVKIINKGGNQRTIKIIQTSRTVYIDINNEARDQFFSFSSNTLFEVSSVTVNVNSNVNWFIDQCPEWIVPSIYDGGEQGKATTIPLTLSMPVPEHSTVGETVSLSYFDDDTKTIFALRKITILPSIDAFVDSNDYVLPQSPLNIEVTSEGGPITVNAFTNTKYKLFPIDITGPFGKESPYMDMLEGYSPDIIYSSEDPNSDKTKLTPLTFSVSKNKYFSERNFKFALVPEDMEEDMFSEYEYPVFNVIQSGSKNITPIVYDETESTEIETEDLGFWVYTYSGITTSEPPRLPILSPRHKKSKVYRSFFAEKGQIVVTLDGADLYKTETDTAVLGQTLQRVKDSIDEWYIIEETGYYFSTNGKATIVKPTMGGYTCDPWKTEFTITLLSTMNNCWDVYNDTLPDWISLEKISGSSEVDSFKVLVDENIKSEDRECVLQFYVDSIDRTIESYVITQTGFEVIQGESELIGITPILSSGKTTFTSDAFEVGLSILAEYSSSITVNGIKHDYHYSEYKYSGIDFSVSSDLEDDSISQDLTGKPKLVVQENTLPESRSIRVTATYDGKTGWIDILQGSTNEIKYYTYSDVEILPDFNTIPLGISKFGFKIKGLATLCTLNLETNQLTEIEAQERTELKFPYLIDKFEINDDCGLSLISPNTLEISGSLLGEMEMSCPMVGYVLNDSREVIEVADSLVIPGVSFETGQENGVINVDNTLLSGDKSGQILSTKLSFTKFKEITIKRVNQSVDVGNYITLDIPETSNHSGPLDIVAKLGDNPTTYLNNKTITLEISDPESKEILKYIHLRYMRSTPRIECELSDTTYGSEKTLSKIKVASNIGYESSAWSNNPDGVSISNGDYSTSNAKFEDVKVIEYKSEGQPSRKWYQKYATESLILKDSDNYGLMKEVPIVLPQGSGSIPGFSVELDNTMIFSPDGSYLKSYILYLPYNANEEKVFKIKSFEPYTINVSSKQTSNGGGLIVEDTRNKIQTKVGSLGEMSFKVKCGSNNMGTSSLYKGAILLSSPTISFTISVYQSSRTGIAKIISPTSKTVVIGKRSNNTYLGGKTVTFEHLYPGWEIDSYGLVSSNLKYPKFNNKSYSKYFGSGGNSGSTYTNSDSKSSSVTISYGTDVLSALDNNSLELKPLSECIPLFSGISSPGTYGIKTAPADILQTSGGTVGITDTFGIKVKPNPINFKVYQAENGQMIEKSELKVTQNFYIDQVNMVSRVSRNLEFYISSDLFERTESYVGKTIMIDGVSTNIYNPHTVFEKLFEKVTLTYTVGLSDVTGRYLNKYLYKPTSYITGNDGKTYAYFKFSNISSINGIFRGTINLLMKGFTTDSKEYSADADLNLILPVN